MAVVTSDAGLRDRLDAIHRRIERSGGSPRDVTVVAVTKGFPASAVDAALDAGLLDIGENYSGELVDKYRPGPRWHFLGAVQRNKVARLAPLVDLWHGVDRAAAGEAIARHRPGASVLVQVDLDGEPGRNGASEADVPALVEHLRSIDLDVAGLMTVASRDRSLAPAQFRRVAAMGRDLGLRELSMGMTDDMDAAVDAGATIVRIGRGLFGARPAAAGVRA